MGLSIVYIKESQVIISKYNCIYFSEYCFIANSVDPDEMLHYAAFHLGLRCLPMNTFGSHWYTKG